MWNVWMEVEQQPNIFILFARYVKLEERFNSNVYKNNRAVEMACVLLTKRYAWKGQLLSFGIQENVVNWIRCTTVRSCCFACCFVFVGFLRIWCDCVIRDLITHICLRDKQHGSKCIRCMRRVRCTDKSGRANVLANVLNSELVSVDRMLEAPLCSSIYSKHVRCEIDTVVGFEIAPNSVNQLYMHMECCTMCCWWCHLVAASSLLGL